MASITALLREGTKFLRTSHVERPQWDAEWLLAHVLGYPRLELILNGSMAVDEKSETQFWTFLTRRARREPLQYILGEIDFYGIKLKVDPRVFIPRSETELLVEWLLENSPNMAGDRSFGGTPLNILDLGTGSGAIAIALAKHFPMSSLLAIDRSLPALRVARKNMERNGVNNLKLLRSNWYDALEGDKWREQFDLIVSNPPYLTHQEFDTAQEEVRRHEPITALVAEEKGIRDIRIILNGAQKFLKKGGIIAIETGILHPKQLQKEYEKYFTQTKILQDLNQLDRFFIAHR
jgi:release factor glutamine methyltransferase